MSGACGRPSSQLQDTIALATGGGAHGTRVADRIYFVAGERLLGVSARTLEPVPAIEFDAPVHALAATPSGDRVFVAVDSSRDIAVVDRYAEDVESRIRLPGIVRDLRMDPLGRFLLARPTRGDSAWVVSLSRGSVVGTLATAWRTDLPFVASDGSLALLRGPDVVFVDPRSPAEPIRRIAGGAADFWYPLTWNGFRPRSNELDAPVQFRLPEPPPDTMPPDTTQVAPDTLQAPSRDSAVARPPAPTGFTVSFAALLNADRARELAAEIEVDGQHARVAVGQRAGTPIYRVVLGPYSTRAEADRVGRAAKRSYFVYEGNP